ncbi:unnamed protein product [Lactuca virosa]|uniref:Uncharacterized protein n=1 Tax=Lactuca virosa TaxID=75947 RepID=A0AAU9M0F1_9ASTR|nr:unnamed protein product [Lactuca virosa]
MIHNAKNKKKDHHLRHPKCISLCNSAFQYHYLELTSNSSHRDYQLLTDVLTILLILPRYDKDKARRLSLVFQSLESRNSDINFIDILQTCFSSFSSLNNFVKHLLCNFLPKILNLCG